MTRRGKRTASMWAVSACACMGLLAAGCGGSPASSGRTVVDADVADTLAFADDVSDTADPEEVTAATSPPAGGADNGNGTVPTTEASKVNPSKAQPASSATAAPQAPTSCSTEDYEVPIPAGWYTPASVNGSCIVFATVPVPALECDCTVGVTVRPYPGQDAPSRVLDWMTFGSSSPTPPTSTSVLGGAATLVVGEWELEEVQAGSLGQYEQRYMYVFDDGANTVEVSAGEFQDWGGNESFADRKAVVDQIAAGLVLP